jgi:hypothetical protein
MENIVGYTVHYLKKVGEPKTTDFNSEIKEQKLEIEQKIIPLNLKDYFEDFIKSIGSRIPLEEEFNQWYSKQNQN